NRGDTLQQILCHILHFPEGGDLVQEAEALVDIEVTAFGGMFKFQQYMFSVQKGGNQPILVCDPGMPKPSSALSFRSAETSEQRRGDKGGKGLLQHPVGGKGGNGAEIL